MPNQSASDENQSPAKQSEINAAESAPDANIESTFRRVIPPIAVRGYRVNDRSRRSSSMPAAASGFSFDAVPKIGPNAR